MSFKDDARRVDSTDARRRQQLSNQLKVINGLEHQLAQVRLQLWTMSVAIYCLIEQIDGVEVVIDRWSLENAPGGRVSTEQKPNGDLVLRIDKEQEKK